MNASVIFKNAKMVLPSEVVHGSLFAENGRISAVAGEDRGDFRPGADYCG